MCFVPAMKFASTYGWVYLIFKCLIIFYQEKISIGLVGQFESSCMLCIYVLQNMCIHCKQFRILENVYSVIKNLNPLIALGIISFSFQITYGTKSLNTFPFGNQ